MIDKMKLIGYCRVSDIKQKDEGHSIDAQKDIIKVYCDKKGYDLVDTYSEQVSGSTKCLDRIEFKKVIDDLNNNKADGIVVTKFDRLSRNLKDMVNIIDDYFKDQYLIHFVDFDHVDLSTPEGMFQLNLFSSFAQLERSMIAKRTKNVLDFKKSKNEKLGGFIPWGFKIDEKIINNKIVKCLVNNKDEMDLIDELKLLKESGKTYKDLVKILVDRDIKNRNGVVKWQPIQICRMLYPQKVLVQSKKRK